MNINDYLHLYWGCRCYWEGSDGISVGETEFIDGYTLNQFADNYFKKLKPILRPLSDMTEEDAIELQCITTPHRCIDWDKDPSNFDVTFHTDGQLSKEHPHYKQVFSITVVDLRRSHDYMNINLNGDILRYNHENSESEPVINDRVYNQAGAVKYLLSKYFDLFGLIDAGLALPKRR